MVLNGAAIDLITQCAATLDEVEDNACIHRIIQKVIRFVYMECMDTRSARATKALFVEELTCAMWDEVPHHIHGLVVIHKVHARDYWVTFMKFAHISDRKGWGRFWDLMSRIGAKMDGLYPPLLSHPIGHREKLYNIVCRTVYAEVFKGF